MSEIYRMSVKEIITSNIQNFPTTRYQGSKRKILSWIKGHLEKLPFNSALDAFGGTGAVSYLFKCMGKSVTYNDCLRFNHLIGKALIENQNVTLEESDFLYLLNESGSKSPEFIQKQFPGFYFLQSENKWLDEIIFNVNHWKAYDGDILEKKKALAFFALFQASLTKRPFNLFHRKNLYLRTNDVPRKFGNKTTWERPFSTQFLSFAEEANKAIFNSGIHCSALNESVFDVDPRNYDLVYFDPPYVSSKSNNETHNYLRCYHFLEGIANYEDWGSYIDYSTKNKRFRDELIPREFSKRNIKDSFEELFSKFRDSIIVISYKKGGVPSIEELKNLVSKYKSRVYTRSIHYKYALNKQNGNAKKNREVLIIGL